MEKILFINGYPALLVNKERILVAGDFHIGLEEKMKEKGIHVPSIADHMAKKLEGLYRSSRARGIVLIGDIKDSVSFPPYEEQRALARFLRAISPLNVRITKGNHDAYLERIIKNEGLDIPVEEEVLLSSVALLHGNAWPSADAMSKDYLVVAHSHLSVELNGAAEKAWLVARIGSNAMLRYAGANKNSKLVIMPAFNDMIIGSRLSAVSASHQPLLKHGVFSWEDASVYSLEGRLLGNAKELSR